MPGRRHAVGIAIAAALAGGVAAVAVVARAQPDEPARAPRPPALAAAFPFESYGPGETARLRVSGAAPGAASLRVVFAGRERTQVASLRLPSLRTGESVRIRIGDWPSGLYAARLKTRRGTTETPFVVRPRKLGENRVGVVLPNRAWQSSTDLELLQWLENTGRAVDVLAQEDLDEATAAQLAGAYELLVFPGRHEYETEAAADAVSGFRSRGGNVLFVSAPRVICRIGVTGAGAYTVTGSVQRPAVRRQLTRLWNRLARTIETPSGLRRVTAAQVRVRAPRGARHGLANSLQQYPALLLASQFERAEAQRLLTAIERAAKSWRDPRSAARAGFNTRRPKRAPGETRVMWFHSEHRRNHSDDAYFDPARPDTLIYADLPGRPLSLVGVMFSMPRGVEGATPGGPITRWHWHVVCTNRVKRGLQPHADGSCPRGWSLYGGSEMLHVWFTGELRSAYAIHAPVPELCKARLVPPRACSGPPRGRNVMPIAVSSHRGRDRDAGVPRCCEDDRPLAATARARPQNGASGYRARAPIRRRLGDRAPCRRRRRG